MQGREQADNQDDISSLKPRKAYSVIDALRIVVDLSVYGLGVGDFIEKSTSLITVVTVEGFCTALSAAIAVHEILQVALEQCCRRDGRTVASTSHSPVQYSLYLSFRMLSIAISATGVGLVASEVSSPVLTQQAAVGLVAIGLGNAANHILNGLSTKSPEVVLLSEDEEMEQGLRKARLSQMRRGIFPADPGLQRSLVQDLEPVTEAKVVNPEYDVPLMRSNSFFQQEQGAGKTGQQGRDAQVAAAPRHQAPQQAAGGPKKMVKKKKYTGRFIPPKSQSNVQVEPKSSDEIQMQTLNK